MSSFERTNGRRLSTRGRRPEKKARRESSRHIGESENRGTEQQKPKYRCAKSQVAVGHYTAAKDRQAPRRSLDNSPVLGGLIQEILELYTSHPEFALAGAAREIESKQEEGVDTFFLSLSALFIRHERNDLRLLAGNVLEATMGLLLSAEVHHSGWSDRNASLTPKIWQCLLNASVQVILAFQAGDSEELVAASQTYGEVSSMLAQYTSSLDQSFTDEPTCDNACIVAAVAGLVAFMGTDAEQYLLILPAMSALSEIARRRKMSTQSDEATNAHVKLLEDIGSLRPVRGMLAALSEISRELISGRQQQQKQLRSVIRAGRESSVVIPLAWIGMRQRLDDLMAKMGRSSPNTSTRETASSHHAVGAPGLSDVCNQIAVRSRMPANDKG